MAYRLVLAAAAAALIVTSQSSAGELAGASAPLGEGSASSYTLLAADGAPVEVGVVFSAGAFDGLPPDKSDAPRCFDVDGNGSIDPAAECEGDHQTVLPLAELPGGGTGTPFLYAMLNYQPHGHPPQAWSVPHFDIHFYSVPLEEVEAIRPGPCEFFIDCDDRKRALMPVPAKYVHADHADVGATVGMMGNHLIDVKTPELANSGTPFTHTWIFGAWDGRIIFHEVMATVDFMSATDDLCAPIKQPQAWATAGHYPERYCFRRDPADGSLRVYLTDFVMRPAG